MIENKALLISTGLPSVSLTRTRQVVEVVPGIVHGCVPSSGVLAITSVQLVPLLVEYSIRTVPLVPEDVQVMFWLLPTCHTSPPLGEVTVIAAGDTPELVYVALHPVSTVKISVVNQMSMLPPLDVKVGGKDLPLNVPSRGTDVVDPSYTLTIS
jgi:hypothetical protein